MPNCVLKSIAIVLCLLPVRLAMAKESAEAAIAAINRAYCQAYNAGDLDKVLDFFADDAITLSPDQEPVRGRDAHRCNFQNAFQRETNRNLELRSIRAESFGQMMYDAGQWTNSVLMPDGSRQKITGYYFTAYREIKGRWKIVTVGFSLLQPIAPPPKQK